MGNDSENPHSKRNLELDIKRKIQEANNTPDREQRFEVINSIFSDLLTNIGKGILHSDESTRSISVSIATQARETPALVENANRLLEFINSIPPLD